MALNLLSTLKSLLGLQDSSQDSILTVVIATAESDFLALTHQTTRTEASDYVVLRMCLVRYNTLKDEGITSHGYNGVSETFQGYGTDLTKSINNFRKVRAV